MAIVSLALLLAAAVFVAGCRFNFWSGPAEVYLTFGMTRQALADKQGAIEDYNKSIQVRKNWLAFRRLGLLHYEGKDNRAAIEDFTQAIELNPHSEYAYPYAYRGAARAEIGDQAGAVKDFDQAIRLDPKNARNYGLRAKARGELGDLKNAIADLDQSIKLNPHDAWSYSTRGYWLDRIGNKTAAIKDFDQSIKIDSTSVWAYCVRGKLRLALGDKKGIADLDQAILLEPKNANSHFDRANARLACGESNGAIEDFQCAAQSEPSKSAYCTHRINEIVTEKQFLARYQNLPDNKSHKVLSSADLAHGERQLKAMLRDRPKMAKYVSAGDAVWKWTVRQFAGESIGSRIFWNKQPPPVDNDDVLAQNQPPSGSTPGSIQVAVVDKDGKPDDGEKLWSGAVFELYNIRCGPQSGKLDDEVSSGKLTKKEEYIRRQTCLEFQAEVRSRIFYRTTWLPQALQKKLSTNDYYWGVNDPNTAEAWFAQFKDRSSYPFHCYGIYYDELMADKVQDDQENATYEQSLGDWSYDTGDYVKALPHYKRALAIKEKILGPKNLKLITCLNHLARMYYSLNRYADAATLYERALAIDEKALGANHPDVAECLKNLAVVYAAQGKKAEDQPL